MAFRYKFGGANDPNLDTWNPGNGNRLKSTVHAVSNADYSTDSGRGSFRDYSAGSRRSRFDEFQFTHKPESEHQSYRDNSIVDSRSTRSRDESNEYDNFSRGSYRGRNYSFRGRNRRGFGRTAQRGRGWYPPTRNWFTPKVNDTHTDSDLAIVTSQSNSQDVAKALNGMYQEIKKLHERFDNLPKARGGLPTPKRGRSRNPSNEDIWSDNPDFGELIKVLLNLSKLKYHNKNWQTVPKSINAKINELTACLNPPLADDTLKAELKQFNENIKSELQSVLSKFFDRKRTELEHYGEKLDRRDIDLAGQIAVKYLMDPKSINLSFEEATALVDFAKDDIPECYSHLMDEGQQATCQQSDIETTDSELLGNLVELAAGAQSMPSRDRKSVV